MTPPTTNRPATRRPTIASRAVLWALIALVIGIAAQVDQVRQTGSLEASLRVGSEAEARAFIEADLGHPVQVTEGEGHDGFHYYLAARDPLALDEAGQDVYVAYRHRRVFGPLLAGLGGILSPSATVLGLSVVGLLGFAIAAAAVVSISRHVRARPWAPLAVVTNVGLILSLQLVTGDALATGLGLWAVAAALRGDLAIATGLLVPAVLTKETSILFAIGLAWWAWSEGNRTWAIRMVTIPTAAFALWALYLEVRLGDALSTNGNLDWPIVGVAEAVQNWMPGADSALGWLAVAAVALAVIGVAMSRNRMLIYVTAPWVAMAIVSSFIVWGDGNNAVRVFAPCWTFGMLGLAHRFETQ